MSSHDPPQAAGEPGSANSEEGVFSLSDWGRPIRGHLGNLLQLLLISPIAGLFLSYPLIQWLHWPPWLALSVGIASSLTLLGLIVYRDHRIHSGGFIRVTADKIYCNAWGNRIIDVPFSDLKRVAVVRYVDGRSPVLALWLPRSRIYVHEARLKGQSLETLTAAIFRAAERAGTCKALADASSPQSILRWKMTRVLMVIVLGILAVEGLRHLSP